MNNTYSRTLMGLVKTYIPLLETRIHTLLTPLAARYPQLVGVRICLGVAEAGFFPGVVY